jgi:hypothetical protein
VEKYAGRGEGVLARPCQIRPDPRFNQIQDVESPRIFPAAIQVSF